MGVLVLLLMLVGARGGRLVRRKHTHDAGSDFVDGCGVFADDMNSKFPTQLDVKICSKAKNKSNGE